MSTSQMITMVAIVAVVSVVVIVLVNRKKSEDYLTEAQLRASLTASAKGSNPYATPASTTKQ